MTQSNEIILSICIPTYNRVEHLQKTLESIINSEIFIKKDNIEIIISNNCSTDTTDCLCIEYQNKFPKKIKYIKQEKEIYPDEHIFTISKYAKGKYIKINNDNLCFEKNALEKILNLINKEEKRNIIFLLNNKIKYEKICRNYDEFINEVGIFSTYIGGLICKKETFKIVNEYLKYKTTHLIQNYLYGRWFNDNNIILVSKDNYFKIKEISKKTGYNPAEVFGYNLIEILKFYIDTKNGISNKTINKLKKEILLFVEKYYFDYDKKHNFLKSGYFKFMLKNYSKDLYFYIHYIKIILKKFLCCSYSKDEKTTQIKFLGIKFRYKRNKKKCSPKKEITINIIMIIIILAILNYLLMLT